MDERQRYSAEACEVLAIGSEIANAGIDDTPRALRQPGKAWTMLLTRRFRWRRWQCLAPNGAPEARGSKEFYKQVKGLTREAEDFVGRGVGRFFA